MKPRISMNTEEKLQEKIDLLREEIKVAREASRITANLVVEQFIKAETILKRLEEKAQTEKELREQLSIKLNELEERTQEVNEANEKLRELDRLKTEFLSTVSHEFRTPLTSILGFGKIIRKRLEEVISPVLEGEGPKVLNARKQVHENLDIIISEGQRLTSMINDVLDITKMEAGKLEWKAQPLSVKDIIERATKATATLFKQAEVLLEKDIPGKLPRIIGDSDRLIQVIINLISNAAKFTSSGSVTCSAGRIGHYVIIKVTDTGIGMTGEESRVAFEKFKQVGNTITGKPAGTGLGLPICKQIIEQHGGQIWVDSKPGEGSTFSFSLPVMGVKIDDMEVSEEREITPEKAREMAPVKKARAEKKSILVVDDDANVRKLLRLELEAEGYMVRGARNALEAFSLVKNKPPDLIVLDVMMPGMNGFDAAAVFKNDPLTMDIPIIILSVIDDVRRGIRIGIDRYLKKPVNIDELHQTINALIARGKSLKKILVVDGEEPAVITLREALEAMGYSVTMAYSDQECSEKALQEKPDMVILNALLADTLNIVKTLRFEKGLKDVNFILLAKGDKLTKKGA